MSDWKELGRTPIAPGSPAGNDVQDLPAYAALEAEMGKLNSPSAASSVDWSQIARLADDILSRHSKHLLVAGYYSVALLNTDRLRGLARGVHVLRDLLDHFWDTMYPSVRRMRGRKNAVEWWYEKVQAAARNLPREEWPEAERQAFQDDLEAVDHCLAEKMEDAPILRPLIEQVTGLISVAGATPPAATAPAAAPPRAAPANSGAAAAPAASADVSDPDLLLRLGLDHLGRAARLIQARDLADPVPYLLVRIAAWLPVRALPPAEGGKTRIPPPEAQIVQELANLYAAGNWPELVRTCESAAIRFLFWIDLSRTSAEGLEQLGHAAAAGAVIRETQAFVQRFRGIENLAFADGTPFANDDTRQWLLSLGGESGRPATPSGAVDELALSVAREMAAAQELVTQNQLGSALGTFNERIRQAGSLRERLAWQLALCRLVLRAHKPRLAAPYTRDILDCVETCRLERWDPTLAVDALTVVLKVLRAQGERSDKDMIESILDRILILDPAGGLDFM